MWEEAWRPGTSAAERAKRLMSTHFQPPKDEAGPESEDASDTLCLSLFLQWMYLRVSRMPVKHSNSELHPQHPLCHFCSTYEAPTTTSIIYYHIVHPLMDRQYIIIVKDQGGRV
jgi:hypothetical protein